MPDEATVRLAFQAVAGMSYVLIDVDSEPDPRRPNLARVVIDGSDYLPRAQAAALEACLDWAAPTEAGQRV